MVLRLGLIGLGEAAQLIHLPVLKRLGMLFEVAAAHDPSPSVAAAVAARWGIARLHASAESLVADAGLDAVLILSPDQYHGRHTRLALAAGRHVLLEKPACLTRSDLNETIGVADTANRVAMVGYMRRYAPAFVAARSEVQALDDIAYVRVRDVICEGPWFFNQVAEIVTPKDDIPAELARESRELRSAMIAEACGGGATPLQAKAYSVLTGLGSHSLSAMRDILGASPGRVTAASIKRGGDQITAMFDYGGYTALYECLIADVVRFEAGIEINTQSKRIAFQYPTPYIRNLPMSLEVQESTSKGNEVRTLGPYHVDPFEAEWRAFYDACVNGTQVPTPLADSMADLELIGEIIRVAGAL